MGYVLVPVPAEYVLDVMRWVLFRAPDSDDALLARDADQLTAFWSEADEGTRTLLRLVASATVRYQHTRLLDLADELGLEGQAVREAVDRLNLEALDEGRELLELRNDTTVGVRGQRGKMTFVAMRLSMAHIVRTLDSSGDG